MSEGWGPLLAEGFDESRFSAQQEVIGQAEHIMFVSAHLLGGQVHCMTDD